MQTGILYHPCIALYDTRVKVDIGGGVTVVRNVLTGVLAVICALMGGLFLVMGFDFLINPPSAWEEDPKLKAQFAAEYRTDAIISFIVAALFIIGFLLLIRSAIRRHRML